MRVFVKRVPLTDLERRPENVLSTANHFDLPTFYQYGVGSAGFGAWRELAANLECTRWVLGGRCAAFPVMYHWRVLPGAVPSVPADGAVAYWHGSPAVGARLDAIAAATTSLVLFLEYVPQTLHEWLTRQTARGAVDWAWVQDRLLTAVTLLGDRGMVHFDVHPGNVLTDGRELYLADFGLALSSRFALSPAEAGFLHRHRSFDRHDALKYLVNWLVSAFCGNLDRGAVLSEAIGGRGPTGVPPEAATIIQRHAATTITMNAFYDSLVHVSKTTPYPLPAPYDRGGSRVRAAGSRSTHA